MSVTKKRGAIRGLITRLTADINANLEAGNIGELKILDVRLATRLDELRKLDEEIGLTLEEDKWEEEIEQIELYEQKVAMCRMKIDELLHEQEEAAGESNRGTPPDSPSRQVFNSQLHLPLNPSASRNFHNVRVKLPKLEITKYGGEAERWQRFWDQFSSCVDKNNSLTDIDKFGYLCSLLVGRAAKAIEGLPMTEANYPTAVQTLKERFGRREQVIRSHLQYLWNLPTRKDDNMSLDEFRKLVDNCHVRIQSLQALEVNVIDQGALLCPAILRAVPQRVHIRWRDKAGPQRSEDDLLGLIKFLIEEVESLELTSSVKQISSFSSSNTRDEKPVKALGASTAALKLEVKSDVEKPQVKKPCLFCNAESHSTTLCDVVPDPHERKNKIRELRRCFICLREKHGAKSCFRRMTRCSRCQQSHHVALCDQPLVPRAERQPRTDVTVTVSRAETEKPSKTGGLVLLKTARVIVKTRGGQEVIRCLFDGGSQRSFVKKSLIQRLALPTTDEGTLCIRGFGQLQGQTVQSRQTNLHLRSCNGGASITICAWEVPEICSALTQVPSGQWKKNINDLGLTLADDLKKTHGKSNKDSIDLLIGADYYWRIITGNTHRLSSELVLVESIFGWLLHGVMPDWNTRPRNPEVKALHIAVADSIREERTLEEEVRRFWALDSLGIQESDGRKMSQENNGVLTNFEKTVQYNDSRYTVRLPWKDDLPDLHDNLEVASERFHRLINRFRRDDDFRKRYTQAMDAYLEAGHAEVVDWKPTGQPVYYLPHHAIIREDRLTTKVRVVFDASSHIPGEPSLNDSLHVGPSLNPEILTIFMQFRWHAVTLGADIEKAFLQVQLAEQDRDAVRFLWIEPGWDGKGEVPTAVWRMTRVLFGAGPSPFLLAATVRHHAKKFQTKYPKASQALDRDLYVDDLWSGEETSDKAYRLYEEVKSITEQAGMPLKKWISNSQELRDQWTKDNESQYPFKVGFPKDERLKVLGMVWNSTTDVFLFNPDTLLKFLQGQTGTKRLVLKAAASVFDPMGLLTPVSIVCRMLFQEAWERGLEWDATLPSDLEDRWQTWCQQLEGLNFIQVPRWYGTTSHSKVQVHIFCDASERAYGATVFLRVENQDKVEVCLVATRSRVAPLKRTTLPRLELLGALVGARLHSYFLEALRTPIMTSWFWTDSTIVLNWVKSRSGSWKTFVANRVEEIHSRSTPSEWRYCPGLENPADLLTRGTTPCNLQTNQLWWKGPSWLQEEEEVWPTNIGSDEAAMETVQREKRTNVVTLNVNTTQSELLTLDRFGHLLKVLRITAWIRRVFHKENRGIELTAAEIGEAFKFWVKTMSWERV